MNFRLTIGRKLFGLSFLALLFLLVLGGTGVAATRHLAASAKRMLQAQEALQNQMEADMGRHALRADVLAAMELGMRWEEARRKAIQEDLAEHAGEMHRASRQLGQLGLEPEILEAVQQARPHLDDYMARAKEIVALAFTDMPQAHQKMDGFTASFLQLDKEMAGITDRMAARSRGTQQESAQAARYANAAILAVLGLAAVVLLAASVGVGRNIVRRIRAAATVAQTVASGDLRSRIDVRGSDETAQLLRALARMNESLVNVVGTVRQASEAIATGTGQIATGNHDLSQRTEEQAGNLQQTAASMEQISATVRANADTARQAAAMAAAASASASRSGSAVGDLVDTMAQITGSSRRVADIVGVIDGIAFQTNLLALNAAVEAARAGEQGRGFAVVAAEVRILAQRSAAAAREIKGLIADSVTKVEAGERQASHAGDTMGEVVRQVHEMTTLIAEIGTATQEQTRGIGEVSQAVTQIDRVTQSNATLVEEAAAAAESLNRQAQHLVEAVSLFRLEEQGPERLALAP